MKVAYFDCFSGISGDMIVAAFINAGLPSEYLFEELKKIKLINSKLPKEDLFITKEIAWSHLRATQFITVENKIRIERYDEMKKIVNESEFSEIIKEKIMKILEKLFKAESKVHGNCIENVHLHELSNIDTLIDICGCLVGLEYFGVNKIYSTPINVGLGINLGNRKKPTIRAKGSQLKEGGQNYNNFPIPAPATIELLKNIPIFSSGQKMELTTPTGAAIVATLCDEFGDIPLMKIEHVGYGAGTRSNKTPSIFRILIGEEFLNLDNRVEKLLHIETNIDDLNPQVYGFVFNRLFALGALDVYLNNIIMKKQRPAINLNVLCKEEKKEEIINAIFNETTSSGIRVKSVDRITLDREIKDIKTKWGVVRVKFIKDGGKIRNFSLEYDDCEKIASQYGISLLNLMSELTSEIGEMIND